MANKVTAKEARERLALPQTADDVWSDIVKRSENLEVALTAAGSEAAKCQQEADKSTVFGADVVVAAIKANMPQNFAEYERLRLAIKAGYVARGYDAKNFDKWFAKVRNGERGSDKSFRLERPRSESDAAQRKAKERDGEQTKEEGKTVDGYTTKASARELASGIAARFAESVPQAIKVLHDEAKKAIAASDEPLAIALLEQALKLRRSE